MKQITNESTADLFESYSALGTDEKLAFLYYVYKEMGDAVTPAAPNAADPELSSSLITDLYGLSESDQLTAMRSIVAGEDTPMAREYGGLAAKNQLFTWYVWAKAMGSEVVDMPGNYEPTAAITNLLNQVKSMDFEGQISLLKEVASRMGYSEVDSPPSQAETGKTDSL